MVCSWAKIKIVLHNYKRATTGNYKPKQCEFTTGRYSNSVLHFYYFFLLFISAEKNIN